MESLAESLRMRNRRDLTAAMLAVLLLLGSSLTMNAAASSQAGTLVRGEAEPLDGGSLVLNGEQIDLIDIDAPELDQVCERDGQLWACGRWVRAELMDLLYREPIVCEQFSAASAACSFEQTSKDLAEILIRKGMAIADRSRSRKYVGVERVAIEEKAGIWASTFVAPWSWRDGRRDGQYDPSVDENRRLDERTRESAEALIKALNREKAIKDTVESTIPSGELIEKCLGIYRPYFMEPRPIYVVAAQLRRENYKNYLSLDVRAKSGFGDDLGSIVNCECVVAGLDKLDQDQSVERAKATLALDKSAE